MENTTLDFNYDIEEVMELLNETDSDNFDSFSDDLFLITGSLLRELTSLIGVVGNIITFFVLFRQRRLQTSVYSLIGTLAVVDFVYATVSAIAYPTTFLFKQWIFGVVACSILIFIDAFHQFYSVILITTAAWLSLCQVINLKVSFVTNFIVAFCSVLWALYTSMHTFLFITGSGQEFCIIRWPNDHFERIHQLFMVFIHTTLPVLVIFTSCVLRKCKPSSLGLLMVTMIIYILLTCPFFVITTFFNLLSIKTHFFLSLLLQLTIAYKPFVYYAMDPMFKEDFILVTSRCFRRNQRREEYNMQTPESTSLI